MKSSLDLHAEVEMTITQENNFTQQKIENVFTGNVHILQSFQEENNLILVSEIAFEIQTDNYFNQYFS